MKTHTFTVTVSRAKTHGEAKIALLTALTMRPIDCACRMKISRKPARLTDITARIASNTEQ